MYAQGKGSEYFSPRRDYSRSAAEIYDFETWVGDDLRTSGVVVDRAHHNVDDFTGLDLDALGARASANRAAAAHGKIVVRGRGRAVVLQAGRDGKAEPVWCGNGVAPLGRLPRHDPARLWVLGPANRSLAVEVNAYGETVVQTWTLASTDGREAVWGDRRVFFLNALNSYALLEGPLPDGVSGEAARRALVGADLGAKLCVIEAGEPVPRVTFYNAAGLHGAAPMSGLASIAIASCLSAWVGTTFAGGQVAYRTRAGTVVEPLLAVSPGPSGTLRVAMPVVSARLTRAAGL